MLRSAVLESQKHDETIFLEPRNIQNKKHLILATLNDDTTSHRYAGPEHRRVEVEDQACTVHHGEPHVREPTRRGIGWGTVGGRGVRACRG